MTKNRETGGCTVISRTTKQEEYILIKNLVSCAPAQVDQIMWDPTSADVLASASVDRTVRIWDARGARAPVHRASAYDGPSAGASYFAHATVRYDKGQRSGPGDHGGRVKFAAGQGLRCGRPVARSLLKQVEIRCFVSTRFVGCVVMRTCVRTCANRHKLKTVYVPTQVGSRRVSAGSVGRAQ